MSPTNAGKEKSFRSITLYRIYGSLTAAYDLWQRSIGHAISCLRNFFGRPLLGKWFIHSF